MPIYGNAKEYKGCAGSVARCRCGRRRGFVFAASRFDRIATAGTRWLVGRTANQNTPSGTLKNMPEKVNLASRQILDFYKKRLPAQDSLIASQLAKLAAANGVTVEAAK